MIEIQQKLMQDDGDITVAQWVARDYRNALVLKKYGIDFCCGGKKTLKEVCRQKGIEVETLEMELKQNDLHYKSYQPDFANWEAGFLANYIVNVHHNFLHKLLPMLESLAEKVFKVHGKNHPELESLKNAVDVLNAELNMHMRKEENILFPYIHKLVSQKENKREISIPGQGFVKHPISVMEAEHERAGEELARISNIKSEFPLPVEACTSWKLLYKMLDDLEADLYLHIHLENNILFPKAIELEQKFLEGDNTN